MKQETKEEVNKHLEGFAKEYKDNCHSIDGFLECYQKKHNLIPSIEVGKVYRYIDDDIICVTSIDDKKINFYGFNESGEWVNKDWYIINNNYEEVSQKEWGSMLLEKAKKDYPKGTKIKSMFDDGVIISYGKFKRSKYEDKVYNATGYGCVYKEGVWAEIVEEVKTEETMLEKLKKHFKDSSKEELIKEFEEAYEYLKE